MNEDFTAKEVVPGTFDVHFYNPGSTSLVADVLEECFGQKWDRKGHRCSLRSLKWTREGGSGIAAVDSLSTKIEMPVVLIPDTVGDEHTEVILRVVLSEPGGGIRSATVRIFVHKVPSTLVEEVVGPGTMCDLVYMQQLRNRVRDGKLCPHCFRPVTDCDCCDADVNPEMGAKG